MWIERDSLVLRVLGVGASDDDLVLRPVHIAIPDTQHLALPTAGFRYWSRNSATVIAPSRFGFVGDTRGSRPATISPRNFGSQTLSAVCFAVTGSVAPRASAKSLTGIRQRVPSCITSNHHMLTRTGTLRVSDAATQGCRIRRRRGVRVPPKQPRCVAATNSRYDPAADDVEAP